jgi:hypothetical protein
VGLGHLLPNRVLTSHLSSPTSCISFRSIEHWIPSHSEPTVLKMVEGQWTMYDGFNDKGADSTEGFEIKKKFLMVAFASDHREAKCSCNRCRNRRMLSEYEMSGHIAKHEFMLNYLVWHQHGEVQAAAPAESNKSDDEDRMDDMIADIGMEYDLGSGDQHPPPEVQNFYRLLVASDEKVHDGTELIILQAVTHLMRMKSKYNFSNQCYNDIVKLIIVTP